METMTDLEQALNAYVKCALWSSLNWDDLDEYGNPGMMDDEPREFAPELLEESRRDLAEMLEAAGAITGADWWTPEQFGHDFWLTRNGHGAGFWDRGQGQAGELLTKAAKVYGEVNLWVGPDGLVYAQ